MSQPISVQDMKAFRGKRFRLRRKPEEISKKLRETLDKRGTDSVSLQK